MCTVACIVEGHGEVQALPILLSRIGAALAPPVYPTVLRPHRIPASKLVQEGELERAVEFAARKTGTGGALFILLDCDDGCPAKEGPVLLERAKAERPDCRIAVVLAKREYEAWFLAAAESLRGRRGLGDAITKPDDPEALRDAKGWLTGQMEGNASYSETTDQPAMTALFDMRMARACDSFDKCYREVTALLAPDPLQ